MNQSMNAYLEQDMELEGMEEVVHLTQKIRQKSKKEHQNRMTRDNKRWKRSDE